MVRTTVAHPESKATAAARIANVAFISQTGDYAGLRGYRDFVPDVVKSAGLSDVPAYVLNDAELAAFRARANSELAAFQKILILTVGFGIGGALVRRLGTPDIS